MKFLFDFFPILLFFIAFKMYDIYVATAVAIAATFVQVGWMWLQHRRVENMHLITLGIMVVFGGATLLLHDETFIMWKPTVVNWLFAAAFWGSHFIGKKPFVQRMMENAVELPDTVWRKLSHAWSLFFVFLGVANLWVAYTFDTDTWVNFKLFGLTGLTLVFIIGQAFYLAKFMPKDEDGQDDDTNNESKPGN